MVLKNLMSLRKYQKEDKNEAATSERIANRNKVIAVDLLWILVAKQMQVIAVDMKTTENAIRKPRIGPKSL